MHASPKAGMRIVMQTFLHNKTAVRMLVDEPRPVSTSDTPHVVMHSEVAGLRADISGRRLDAVRAVIALWRNTSGFCFGT